MDGLAGVHNGRVRGKSEDPGPLLAVVIAVVALAALVGCQGETDATTQDSGDSGDVPITQRAIAGIALDHLPTNTSSRRATKTNVMRGQAALGADLYYPADSESHGALVRIYLTPDVDADSACNLNCDQRTVAGGTLYFGWGEDDPEEDPGSFSTALVLADQMVLVAYTGVPITEDPRTMSGLTVTPEMLEDIVFDPRLRLATTQDAVDDGEALADWGDGEPDQ